MATNKSVLRLGDIVYLSSGDYSDYSVAGVFLIAKQFRWDLAQQEYAHEQQLEHRYLSGYGFPSWLAQRGYIVEVDAQEWHYD